MALADSFQFLPLQSNLQDSETCIKQLAHAYLSNVVTGNSWYSSFQPQQYKLTLGQAFLHLQSEARTIGGQSPSSVKILENGLSETDMGKIIGHLKSKEFCQKITPKGRSTPCTPIDAHETLELLVGKIKKPEDQDPAAIEQVSDIL